MRRIIIAVALLVVIIPAAYADEVVIPIEEPFLEATFENITIIDETDIPPDTFTTLDGHTFGYENAKKITYMTSDGRTDYMIIWSCDITDDYLDLIMQYDLNHFYSNYGQDSGSVVYIEESAWGDGVNGIILDCQNVSYTEADLVYDILGLKDNALSTTDWEAPADSSGYAYSGHEHYSGPVVDPYDMVRNDPYAYYDHFDYEDNPIIDDYLYDAGYDE